MNSVYLCAFFLFTTLTSPALTYVAFRVHCDALALGFATLAIGALALFPNRTLSYMCSAVFASLAFWCKVTLIGLFPALLIAVWIVDGWRYFIKYALVFFSIVAVVSATIFLVFGLEEVAFNVFLVPAAHPWGDLHEWNPGDVPRATGQNSCRQLTVAYEQRESPGGSSNETNGLRGWRS